MTVEQGDTDVFKKLAVVSKKWNESLFDFVKSPHIYDDEKVLTAILEMRKSLTVIPTEKKRELKQRAEVKLESITPRPAEEFLISFPNDLKDIVAIQFSKWPINSNASIFMTAIALFTALFSSHYQYFANFKTEVRVSNLFQFSLLEISINILPLWQCYRTVMADESCSSRSLRQVIVYERLVPQFIAYFGLGLLGRLCVSGMSIQIPLMCWNTIKWIMYASANVALSRSTVMTSKQQGMLAASIWLLFTKIQDAMEKVK